MSRPGDRPAGDGPALHRLAVDPFREFHPAVGRIVAEADVPATFSFVTTSARPVEQWDAANVTLLRDSIHTMSPGQGEGANTTLRDAQLLRQALVEVAAGGMPLGHAKRRYEAEMLRYGFEAVANSLHKPFAPGRKTGPPRGSEPPHGSEPASGVLAI
jgi:2-polyprenyl-6-methoxyphenol hydroxylase-like FAD-dependent oxidoreductase